MFSKSLFSYAIVTLTIAIGILLITLNWKKSTATIAKSEGIHNSLPEFSESAYHLAVSEEITEMGFTIDKDFPINSELKQDSLTTLVEHSINAGLASAAALYNEKLADLKQFDSLYLQSARYLVVAGMSAKVESRGMVFLQKAQLLLDKILTHNPKNLDAKTLKGYVLVRTQPAPMQGIAVLQEVLQEDPNNLDALYILGDFSIESGQFEKALERFKKLLSLQPFNSDYNFKVSEVFSRLNMKDSADFYLKRGTEFRTKETITRQ
ncbi:MAG: tetratricopeptide repeat protein [Bacteroidia bacterium]|nr:tetratricopeptide repeat protein [Bacteroidia bacterium]